MDKDKGNTKDRKDQRDTDGQMEKDRGSDKDRKGQD